MNVTLEQLYVEACKALGEVVVAQRLLSAEVIALTEENKVLREALAAKDEPEPDPRP